MQAPPLGQYDPYRYGNNNPGQYDSYPLKVPPNAPPGAGFSNGSSLSMSIPPQPRTPSPTPSEEEEARKGVLDWGTILNWRTYAKKKYIVWYIGITLILVLVALMTLYHKQIVAWLTPAANWMKNLKFGWLIPVAILFVISFPPLFGHEIVAVLVGVVWGLWIGFAIVASGSVLGEVGNFYAFRYLCKSRGEKLEKNNTNYACLVKVVKDGGFKIALAARLSAIPGHFTTAVFATCGMGFFTFLIAAILSSPKQLITVYLGVILDQTTTSTKGRIISDSVLAVSFLITIGAAWWIYSLMQKAKPEVMRQRRRLRGSKISVMTSTETFGLRDPARQRDSADAFNPNDSDSDLHAPAPQRWDQYGRAIDAPYDPPYYPPPQQQQSPSTRRAYLPYQGRVDRGRESEDTITGYADSDERSGSSGHEYSAPPGPPPQQPQFAAGQPRSQLQDPGSNSATPQQATFQPTPQVVPPRIPPPPAPQQPIVSVASPVEALPYDDPFTPPHPAGLQPAQPRQWQHASSPGSEASGHSSPTGYHTPYNTTPPHPQSPSAA